MVEVLIRGSTRAPPAVVRPSRRRGRRRGDAPSTSTLAAGRAGDGPDRHQHRAAGRLRRPGPPALRSGGAVRSLDRQQRRARSTPAIAARSRCCWSTSTRQAGRRSRGDRIAQLVFQRVERARFVEVDRLPGSDRGAGGYGSTGGFAADRQHQQEDSRDFPSQGSKDRSARRSHDERAEAADAARWPDELDELESSDRSGPWDRQETDADEGDGLHRPRRAGGQGRPGLELRLQVDEQDADRGGGDARRSRVRAWSCAPSPHRGATASGTRSAADIAAEAAKRGGTATEVDGEFGTELKVVVPVQTPDGAQATQTSRIVGVEVRAGCCAARSSARAPPSPTRRACSSRRSATSSSCAATARWRRAT